jgi:hypothetical protein
LQITYDTFQDISRLAQDSADYLWWRISQPFNALASWHRSPTIIGVMPAMLLSRSSLPSMIGMIALAGIIVRNSILLVDFIELQVPEYVFKDVQSGCAGTTDCIDRLGCHDYIFILDDPIFNGLAISLIFGILVSTLLTLVVIPFLLCAFQ